MALPAADERCNQQDDNCDGTVDEGCPPPVKWALSFGSAQAEVSEFRLEPDPQQNVAGFDVAVKQPDFVGMVQGR